MRFGKLSAMMVTNESNAHEVLLDRPRRCVVALEQRLKKCGNVVTLGVKPNFNDYTDDETALIRAAQTIYYPSRYYAELFETTGKKTFPGHRDYLFAQDKIKQTALFQLQGIPHPRTRVFYGKKQKARILDYFSFPMIAKIPRGSALGRGVYLIETPLDLKAYCSSTHTAYVQEYLPIKRDIRVVVIGKEVVHAYYREPAENEFRANLFLGAKLSFTAIPTRALELARHTAAVCGWDDVGIDICECRGVFYVLEANMKYGKRGFIQAGIDYIRLMERLIEDGKI
jgi:ribosomal protein S6--L-glutamate ligase